MAGSKKNEDTVAEKAQAKKGDKKKSINNDIEELQAQLDESKDKFIRLFAEFENYKKRNMRERLELMRTAAQDTMSDILPVLDDFDRAKKSADDDTSPEQFSEGVELVYNKLHSILQAKGLKAMESTGEVFDPELHEAITEIPAATEDQKGRIIDTVEKGYMLNDKIIRFAKVVVGK
jgi:molecular chaperone GrpE